MSRDPAVDFLLDFNGEKLEQENGYWIKIEARLLDVSSTVPHGLRYSLTLHDCSKRRILGYDNAHAVKLPKKSKRRGSTQAFGLCPQAWCMRCDSQGAGSPIS